MAYSGVFVFGDSLVDSGNALKLAQWYGTLTFSDLPDGAPTARDGYFQGRFTNGYSFADLIANQTIGAVTKPVFPYGFEDPWLGLEIAPWAGDPSGNNLNFAYGGARIRQGSEAVLDLDGQTDAFRDAVDGDADPNALYMVTIGGNDVRSLVPTSGTVVQPAQAYGVLASRANVMLHELSQLVSEDGVRNILITGMADVGLVARYDVNNDNALGTDTVVNGVVQPGEASRSALATEYSQQLDHLIRTVVIPGLETLGATVTYVPLMDYVDEKTGQAVTGALAANWQTLAVLNGVQPVLDGLGNVTKTAGQVLSENILTYDKYLFFDGLHPTAQAHALLASFMQARLNNTPWVETMPLLGADVDYRTTTTIGVSGEVDKYVIAMAPGTTYTFQMLGVSSVTDHVAMQLGYGGAPTAALLADPSLRLLTAGGSVVRTDNDSGAGLDAVVSFQAATAGTYTLEAKAVGAVTGAYILTGAVSGAAMLNPTTYTVTNAATLVIEGAGTLGDVVKASVSYALTAGSEIEALRTTNDKGKTAINLTGNEFDQTITGNSAANVMEGKGGSDTLYGLGGNDRFILGAANALSASGSNIDHIKDYANGDIVDVSQVLKVAGGTNVLGSGFLRVTTGGLIQVDTNGGGDAWTTLATVNGSGAVKVRYMSGTSLVDVSATRVADSSALSVQSTASDSLKIGLLGGSFDADAFMGF